MGADAHGGSLTGYRCPRRNALSISDVVVVHPFGVELGLNGPMVSSAVEQLWQALAENDVALVCVRGPQCRWADLMTVGDLVGELTWLARETGEIAEQYRAVD